MTLASEDPRLGCEAVTRNLYFAPGLRPRQVRPGSGRTRGKSLLGTSLLKQRTLDDLEMRDRSRKTKPSSTADSHWTQVPSDPLMTAEWYLKLTNMSQTSKCNTHALNSPLTVIPSSGLYFLCRATGEMVGGLPGMMITSMLSTLVMLFFETVTVKRYSPGTRVFGSSTT